MTPDEASARGIPLVVTMNQQDREAIAIVRLHSGELVFADSGILDDECSWHPLHLLPPMQGDGPEWTGVRECGDPVTIFECPEALLAYYDFDRLQRFRLEEPALFDYERIRRAAEDTFGYTKSRA